MKQFTTYAFVDGAYLRKLADDAGAPLVDPHRLAGQIVGHNNVTSLGGQRSARSELALHRVMYYDAAPDDERSTSENLQEYWRAIELLPETHLGFGSVRGTRTGRPRQKGVDTLLTVHMLTGAVDRLFAVAVLVAGDSDFVPVVREVLRRGVLVVVAGDPASTADDLIRSADRFVPIGAALQGWLPPLVVAGRSWRNSADSAR